MDCAPTAETLRLLSLPEIMNWYIERIFPVERKVVKAVRPLVSRMTSLPIAGDQVFDAVERLHRNLDAVKVILTDETVSSVRLVVNPEKMVISEARRTYTYLGLFGYRVDAVVVNRVLPPRRHRPLLREVEGHPGRAPGDGARVVRAGADPPRRDCSTARWSGSRCSRRWARRSTVTSTRPSILYHDDPIRVRKRGDRYVLTMRLPFVSRDDMDIHRRGEELVVRVGSYKRNLILPQTLKRMVVREANFAGDHLEIVFGRGPNPQPGGKEADDGRGRQESAAKPGRSPPPPRAARRSPAPRGATGTRSARSAWCPICMAVTAVQPLKPEVIEHLLKAGTELLLAFRR